MAQIGGDGKVLSGSDRLREALKSLAAVVRPYWHALGYAQGALVTSILYLVITLGTGQGEQAVAVATQEEAWGVILLWGISLLFWCLCSFMFARWTQAQIDETLQESMKESERTAFKETREPPRFARKHFPRWAGLLPAIAVAASIYLGADPSDPLLEDRRTYFALGALAIGALVALIAWRRRAVLQNHVTQGWPLEEAGSKQPAGSFMWRFSAWALPGIFAVVVLLSVFLATTIGALLGTVSIFFLGSALVVGVLFSLRYLQVWSRLPLVRIAVVVVVILSTFEVSNSYSIRQLGPASAERKDLFTAFEDWKKGRTPTLVVVASAGGGIRAGVWTLAALDALGRSHPELERHLFAVSGVSGGALGGAYYAASRHPDTLACLGYAAGQTERPEGARRFLQRLSERDYLAAPTFRLLFSDWTILQIVDLFGLGSFLPFEVEDRAAALERAWEQGWQDSIDELRSASPDPEACDRAATLFAKPFLSFWPEGGQSETANIPYLFHNGTSVGTGRRLITTPVRLVGPDSKGDGETARPSLCPPQSARSLPKWQDYSVDLLADWGRSLPFSTAANNAARFPFVEPAGLITFSEPKTIGGKVVTQDRIVDGGYFENFGALTAQEILTCLFDAEAGDTEPTVAWRVLVIQIVSDPDRLPLSDAHQVDRKEPTNLLGDLLGPAYAVYAARTAHGVEATRQLRNFVVDMPTRYRGLVEKAAYVELPLPVKQAPLGWLLSSQAARTIIGCLQPSAEGGAFCQGDEGAGIGSELSTLGGEALTCIAAFFGRATSDSGHCSIAPAEADADQGSEEQKSQG